VSSATVAENARRSVARDSAGGTKRWNAKAREGRNRRGYPLASNQTPGTASLLAARPEWSVTSDAEAEAARGAIRAHGTDHSTEDETT
jgi:hypothetical protein